MRLSEAIKKLKELQKAHGDLQFMYYYDEYGDYFMIDEDQFNVTIATTSHIRNNPDKNLKIDERFICLFGD